MKFYTSCRHGQTTCQRRALTVFVDPIYSKDQQKQASLSLSELCLPRLPSEIRETKSQAHFTGVAPADGTGVRDKRRSS